MTRIVIIQGHPDPVGAHLCHGLADAYAAGARDGGHEIRIVDVARLDFPMLRTQAEFTAAPPEAVAKVQETIRWADHLVLVFPLWLGTMPGAVKVFLEQVFRPGFAFGNGDGGFPKKLLAGRTARVVVTMGMPAFLFRWYFFEHGLRGLTRNVLHFVGIRPVRETLFGMVEGVGAEQRTRWLAQMAELGRRGG
jgi:putative NADPH-quinone reductase